jgi:Family of unknown function (DUF5941)/CDP-alcohol phosphatidyltransferase
VDAAVLLATAPAAEGGPAALLPWRDRTLLARLLGQLADLGVPRAVVITRPAWEQDVRTALGNGVDVLVSPDVAADLGALAEVATASGDGGIVAAYADIVTHGAALAGLLADPRVTTGVLSGGRWRAMAFRIRSRRGRIVSAASPYHAVYRPTGTFLGVLKVAPADVPALVAAAQRLAPLSAAPPAAWLQELDRKEATWRLALARLAAGGELELDEEDASQAAPVALSPEDEARLRNRMAAAPDDAVALVLVGLVRGGAQLGGSHLRRLYWSRPLTAETAAESEREIDEIDEDRVLLDSAVKGTDGFFTTFFVSPYSRYIARWAARRGLTPNQVTTASMLIGVLAAAAFATGERWGLVTGAVLLQLAFTTDCVDGQLARYTRTFSKLGAWLDSVFDRTKEYLAFAGLAIGASRMGDPVWLLACAAITAQTVRHMSDFSFGTTQQQAIRATTHPPLEQSLDSGGAAAAARRDGVAPVEAPRKRSAADRALSAWRKLDRGPGVRWVKRILSFPIGERFAAISITAALWTPRTTFVVLLSCAAVAGLYTQTGRVLRSVR